MEKLINALRCYASMDDRDVTCHRDCPYRLINEVNTGNPVPEDITIDYCGICDFDRMALDAAEALEKQIPKKPIGDLNSVPHYRCPVCKNAVVLYEYSAKLPHCQWCGQKLDWEEE